jgi:hypothetical protein
VFSGGWGMAGTGKSADRRTNAGLIKRVFISGVEMEH